MIDFKQISILGMGLIGGSIGLKLKTIGYEGKIIGQDVSLGSLEMAKLMGALDEYTTSLKMAVRDSDLVIIAVPMGCYEELFKEINRYLKPNAIVTDVGSVKEQAVTLAQKHLSEDVQFLGGHPMSGSEKSGITAASPFLLENAFYFLTPMENTTVETIEKLKSFIEAMGAYPVVTDGKEHDHIVALISHIPHVMAGLLVNMVGQNHNKSYLSYIGGGFRDTTRIASGNPHMWRDILLMNRDEICNGLGKLEKILKSFRESLVEANKDHLLKELTDAKETRDSIPKHIKDAIPVIFEIYLDVEDRPGILGEVTQLMGKNAINIKEIEIVHAREGENGALRLGFSTIKDQKKALDILPTKGYRVAWHDEENKTEGS